MYIFSTIQCSYEHLKKWKKAQRAGNFGQNITQKCVQLEYQRRWRKQNHHCPPKKGPLPPIWGILVKMRLDILVSYVGNLWGIAKGILGLSPRESLGSRLGNFTGLVQGMWSQVGQTYWSL